MLRKDLMLHLMHFRKIGRHILGRPTGLSSQFALTPLSKDVLLPKDKGS